jgi:hypothetical protein
VQLGRSKDEDYAQKTCRDLRTSQLRVNESRIDQAS